MEKQLRGVWIAGAVLLGLFLCTRYLLVLAKPFLAGLLLALAAEPGVRLLDKRCRLGRCLGAGIGVTLTLLLSAGILAALLTWGVQELGKLGALLPQMVRQVQQGLGSLRVWIIELSQEAPEGVQQVVKRTVDKSFSSGEMLLEQVINRAPQWAASFLGGVPDGLLTVGTALLSAYLISARLPRMKQALRRRIPRQWQERYIPALKRGKKAVGAWCKAQGKLMLVTWGIVTLGFFLLKISPAPLWALGVAVVDALPVLGSGTVLIPWTLLLLIQGQYGQALGMGLLYLAAVVVRSVLEPRLVGRQLGLDPLVTLAAFYAGYRLWGILGMILAPICAAAARSFFAETES